MVDPLLIYVIINVYFTSAKEQKGFDVYFIDPKIWIWIIVFLFTFRKFITNRVSVKFEILQGTNVGSTVAAIDNML